MALELSHFPTRLRIERLILQLLLGVLALIPISAGGAMAIYGPALLGLTTSVSADSHVRYLSGLLLGIGLVTWTTIPRIEIQGARLAVITLIVAIGGLARLWSLIEVGRPHSSMVAALFLELLLTPLLYVWQQRVARSHSHGVD